MRELRGSSSLREMAEAIGIKLQAWKRYEDGGAIPGGEIITKICRVHACSADWLLGLKESGSATVKMTNSPGAAVASGRNARASVGPNCEQCSFKQLANLMDKLGITVEDLASIAAKKSAAKVTRKK